MKLAVALSLKRQWAQFLYDYLLCLCITVFSCSEIHTLSFEQNVFKDMV